jgi:membrane-bound ClpP family serine protease
MGLIITLLLLGLVLLFVELFLVSGVGIAGFLGIAAFVWASVHAFNTLGPTEGGIVTAISVILVGLAVVYALRSKTWQRFELGSVIGNTPRTDAKVSVGDTGTTISRIAPMGTARIGDITCEVRSVSGMIDPGTEIVVTSVTDHKITVKPS